MLRQSPQPNLRTIPTARPYYLLSRQPVMVIVFVMPLFVFYHCSLKANLATQTITQNSIDFLLAKLLQPLGLGSLFIGLIFAALIILFSRERLPLSKMVTVFFTMFLESVAWSLPLFILAKIYLSVTTTLDDSSFVLQLQVVTDNIHCTFAAASNSAVFYLNDSPDATPHLLQHLGLAVGAGVYEELIFRLVLLGSMLYFVQKKDSEKKKASSEQLGLNSWICVLLQATIFAALHNWFISHEDFNLHRFSFRVLAGVYFALVYIKRGYGITCGCHSAYDVGLVLL